MCTMQEYFSYGMTLLCGLPSVDIRGTLDDWRSIVLKIKDLDKYDTKSGEMVRWRKVLLPILEEIIRTKQGVDNMDSFWKKMCHINFGCGDPSVTGCLCRF